MIISDKSGLFSRPAGSVRSNPVAPRRTPSHPVAPSQTGSNPPESFEENENMNESKDFGEKSCREIARNSRISAKSEDNRSRGRLPRMNATCRDGREHGGRTHRSEFLGIFLCSFVGSWSLARRVVVLNFSVTGAINWARNYTLLHPITPYCTLKMVGRERRGWKPSGRSSVALVRGTGM
jgi:hypothetical protein